jgi:hypothetical protein
MTDPDEVRGRKPALRAGLIAGLCTFAFISYSWMGVHDVVPIADPDAWTWIAFLALVVVGVMTGLVSGRYRDALASWIGVQLGGICAWSVAYATDPGWPRSEDGFLGGILLMAWYTLPVMVVAHVAGVTIRARRTRTRRQAAG